MYKTFGGVIFEYDSMHISLKQTMGVLQKNSQAYAEFKKAKRSLDISSTMGFAGGALLAIPVITSVAGGDPEWSLAIAGGALALGSIPVYRSFKGRALHALDIYNGQATSRIRTDFYFFGPGARLVIRF